MGLKDGTQEGLYLNTKKENKEGAVTLELKSARNVNVNG